MNIIKSQALDRAEKLSVISATLKKAFDADLPVDKENMIRETCSRFSVSRRTAREYLDIALVSFNTEEEKIDGKVFIKELKQT